MNHSKIKIIAILSMLIDHIGAVLIINPGVYLLFRSVGRLAFPIFAFLIAEGCLKTRSMKKYLLRLFVFGLISEIPFDYAITGKIIETHHQNVFFTLFLGAFAIYVYKSITENKGNRELAGLAWVVLISISAGILRTDYGTLGVMLIFILYYYRNDFKKQAFSIILMNLLMMNPIQLWGCLAILPLYFYNREKGLQLKFIFYFFYPVHLLILGMLARDYLI